ncbi:two-component system sensor histidine kinase NtrB [Enhygromyxa salina]|uniref:histidine kinase n=1 Tax=Enhygromyxa salina TaxID=215803 RepID=A0A2S9YTA6_9BACT|nr:ATP-binding protein [Enhygromyxa salina]PRQ08318.1 Blue-light-activated protein [Enhygromyxa salina]
MTSDDKRPGDPIALTVNGMPWEWDVAAGNLLLFGEPAVAFGALPSLERLVGPLREEAGEELFRLLVALSSTKGTKQYYQNLITKFGSTFEEGFLTWGEAVAAAGWGRFSLPKYDRARCEAIVRVINPWELQMQTDTPETWGCPFLQGKLIGIFSEAFGVTCWAYEQNIQRDGAHCSIEFHIARSQRTIAVELAQLRAARQRERDGELAREVERKTAALRESEDRQRAVLLSLSDLVFTIDANLVIEDYLPPRGAASAFPPAEAALRHTVGDAFGEALATVLGEAIASIDSIDSIGSIASIDAGHEIEPGSQEFGFTLDGEVRRYEARFAPRQAANGELDGLTVVVRDFTRQRAIEERLRQAQKMESLGQLASGVGHDFNNLLTAIMSATDLLAIQVPQPLQPLTETVLDACDTAAALIRKLLDFARPGLAAAADVDMHDVVSTSVSLLEASVSRSIRVVTQLEAPAHHIYGDAKQLQSALLNLGVNARDAMPHGGELRFATHNLTLSADDCATAAVDLSPGPYIEVVVSDTGEGMDEPTRRRVFEPFFTTKAAGKGTGLGLAAVYGAVGEHRGQISLDSEVGKGTTFRIRLPIHAASGPPITLSP